MLKSIGVKPYVFPMPVLMIATYCDDDSVDVMNMAWGGVCAENMVALNIDEDHMTAKNIKKRGAFTLSVADVPHIEAADSRLLIKGQPVGPPPAVGAGEVLEPPLPVVAGAQQGGEGEQEQAD